LNEKKRKKKRPDDYSLGEARASHFFSPRAPLYPHFFASLAIPFLSEALDWNFGWM
jgi:hypothetical protein